MRLKKMGAGFYFEPDSGDQHQEMQRIAESGEQIDLVPVNSPAVSPRNHRVPTPKPSMM